jgi:hypothetical protein
MFESHHFQTKKERLGSKVGGLVFRNFKKLLLSVLFPKKYFFFLYFFLVFLERMAHFPFLRGRFWRAYISISARISAVKISFSEVHAVFLRPIKANENAYPLETMPRPTKRKKVNIEKLSKAWNSRNHPAPKLSSDEDSDYTPDCQKATKEIQQRFRQLEVEGFIPEFEFEDNGDIGSDSDGDLDEEGEAEVKSDAALLLFMARLKEARKVAEEKEKECSST